MANPFKSPAILSLCTGIRGLERGLERVLGKIRVAAYVENEAFIIENLLDAMEAGLVDAAPIWPDLTTLNYAAFRGKIHGLIGGYPCTPFSVAGQRKGETDERHLWPFICAGILAARPVWCYFENSDDHISLGYDSVYKDLREMGYLVEAGIFSAEEAGSTHERQRLFIFAILADTDLNDTRREFAHFLYPKGKGAPQKNQRERDRDEPGARREVVADADSFGIYESGSEHQSEQFEPDGVSRRNELGDPNSGRDKIGRKDPSNQQSDKTGDRKELEYAARLGRQRQPHEPRRYIIAPNRATDARGGVVRANTAFRGWPAGQGYFQYPYEPPRTIKSRLVYTIAGYNFVGDLHRAIGNSVVEQTAALAFIHLLNKHLSK